jgi:hypothetical protein
MSHKSEKLSMNTGLLILLTLAFGSMFFMIQRAEAKRRLVVALFMIVPGILIQRYANYADVHGETQLAFVIALILNLLFWLLIGRYNPPSSSDSIQVIGMDD